MKPIDFEILNSATKYPSILTYHELDQGKLTDLLHPIAQCPVTDIVATEKIDGTNARIILFGKDDFVIGSRETLLYAKGDRIENPAQGIVGAIKGVASKLRDSVWADESCVIVYGEVYGGKINAHHQYTSSGATSFQVFDIAEISHDTLNTLMHFDAANAARWRDGGGLKFYDEARLELMRQHHQLSMVPRFDPPRFMPQTAKQCVDYLNYVATKTYAGIDAWGKPEGVVLRSRDRSVIAKMRHEDYKRFSKEVQNGKA